MGGQVNKGDDSQVSFWNKTKTKESVSSALGRGFRLGMGFYKVLFIPIVIASNWIPYSAENINSKNWSKSEEEIAKELDLYFQLGEPVYFNQLSSNRSDSFTYIQLSASGKYEQGLVLLTLDRNDSILDMTFEMEYDLQR